MKTPINTLQHKTQAGIDTRHTDRPRYNAHFRYTNTPYTHTQRRKQTDKHQNTQKTTHTHLHTNTPQVKSQSHTPRPDLCREAKI